MGQLSGQQALQRRIGQQSWRSHCGSMPSSALLLSHWQPLHLSCCPQRCTGRLTGCRLARCAPQLHYVERLNTGCQFIYPFGFKGFCDLEVHLRKDQLFMVRLSR